MIGGARIEIAGRLVGEQHARAVGDRAGDGDALLFAAGKLGRPMRQAMAEPQIGEEFGCTLTRLPARRDRGSSAAA